MNEKIPVEILEKLSRSVMLYKSSQINRNVFSSISDVFYRENLHSDIIAYYLESELAKRKFIEWINEQLQKKDLEPDKKHELVFEEYMSGKIVREDAGIDILLYSNDEKKAIIIENKSNEAADQYRQLPNYVGSLIKQNITIEAILYLNKNHLKQPDKTGWKQNEIECIDSKLVSAQLLGDTSFITQQF